MVESIADAVVLKQDNLFFLCNRDGGVPLSRGHGLGLYYHDCRYLNGYELQIAETSPMPLAASAEMGFTALLQLTNAGPLPGERGTIDPQELAIRWERTLDRESTALCDILVFENFGTRPFAFPVTLAFKAGFEDVFAVRDLTTRSLPGKKQPPRWKNSALVFAYEGADGIRRTVQIGFSPSPRKREGPKAHFSIHVPAGQSKRVVVRIAVQERQSSQKMPRSFAPRVNLRRIHSLEEAAREEWLSQHSRIESDSYSLNRVMLRSKWDLHMLRSNLDDEEYFSAGIPWFATLFGRDSLIASLQTAAYAPQIAEQTLRLLAKHQAARADRWRDAEPGGILHEFRVGELANLNRIPHTPYYGTVDATPLFLILVAQHAAWTGSLKLFDELRANVEAALKWIDSRSANSGYLEYDSSAEGGLANQGWKDSGDAMVNGNGALAKPPIAPAEVQGYAYRAKLEIAELFHRSGDERRAGQLCSDAAKLRKRFNQDFWVEKKGCYAMALEREGKPLTVVSSNAGQVLWSGIADSHKAGSTAERLLRSDMFSGWGIRTLSKRERRYSPLSYHRGTVWPHDNSIIAAGLRQYGFDDYFLQLFLGIVSAATFFPQGRLPELFAGFDREQYPTPVSYPVACHPQAWSAGTIPYLLHSTLGLKPEGLDRRLRIVRPLLPDLVDYINFRKIRVGEARADLHFWRDAKGQVQFDVTNREGELDIVLSDEGKMDPPV